MARPKSAYPDLPKGMTARRVGSGLLFYLQSGGRKIPLGSNLMQAIALYERLNSGDTSPEDARFGGLALLTEEEIAKASISVERRCGVYFLLLAGRIVYVGQSKNVWQRVMQHKASGRAFDSFCWQPCEPSKLDDLEAHCIRKYKPPYNSAKPSFRTVLNIPA